MRDALTVYSVIGEGRRGQGEVVIGRSADTPDFSEPFGAVFAYGAIETTEGTVTATLRETVNHQTSFEIVGQKMEEIPAEFRELRRWTYSTWKPGDPCPQCLQTTREVKMTGQTPPIILAFCARDRRIWVYDGEKLVNRLIPVTNFYNELMIAKGVRDSKVALESKRLFSELKDFSDADLADAFSRYNRFRTKVALSTPAEPEGQPTLLFKLRKSLKLGR
jgi:hypothetical protein